MVLIMAESTTTKPYNRKYNRKKVKQLAAIGVKPSDIARAVDTHPSTITRYLKSIEAQTADIKAYSNNKADALCLDQLKSATVPS